jgi:IS30 family transposase
LSNNNNNKTKARMVEWRRNKVQELLVQGHSQWDIADNLKVDQSTISRDIDIDYLRQQSKQKIRKYVEERLPDEYEKCLVGITSILKEAWTTSQNTEINKREKIQALSLAKECYSMKLDLLTNATVVNDAMKFVSDKSKENLKKLPNKEERDSNKQQSKEEEQPDYNNEDTGLEERETGEIMAKTTTTTNQIF